MLTAMKISDFQKRHRTEWHNFLWQRFLEQFSGKKAQKAVNAIIGDYEKRLITKRLAALALLREGASTRDIERILWLSRATISALKKSFFSEAEHYISPRLLKGSRRNNKILSKENHNSWLDEIFSNVDIWEIIKNPPRPASTGIKKHMFNALNKRM